MRLDAEGSGDAYREMVAFADTVDDDRAANLLSRTLEGRGAFHRLRETLAELPSLREHWFTFASACTESRAIAWLLDAGFAEHDDGVAESTALAPAAAGVCWPPSGAARGLQIDASVVTERSEEIMRAIDAGQTTTLLRDGEVWAVIEPS